jgi:hypothetical protein
MNKLLPRIERGGEKGRYLSAWSKLAGVASIVLIQGIMASGAIVAPYTPDEQTLHLWHLDEPAAPLADAMTNGVELRQLEYGATLGNESYIGAKKFGAALGTYVGNPALPPGCAGQRAGLSAQAVSFDHEDKGAVRYVGSANAFTFEAIVRVDFDPGANYGPEEWGRGRSLWMEIVSGDAAEDADRVFQFRLAPIGTSQNNSQPLLEFINLNRGHNIQSLSAAIPTVGPDAIRTGDWYHLAVSYSGQPDNQDNFKFYWTLIQPQQTAANLIGTGRMSHNLPAGCHPEFSLGQSRRPGPTSPVPRNNFVGLIDEVRLSGVVRGPGEMLFGETVTVSAPLVEPGHTSETPATGTPSTPVEKDVTTRVREPITFMNGAVARGPTNAPRLALLFSCREFDDAAFATVEALKAQQTKASFFATSTFLQEPTNRLIVQSLLAQGHYVGLQSDNWTEFSSAELSPATAISNSLPPDIEAHLKRLTAFGFGIKDVRFFLPTLDQLNPVNAGRAQSWGLTMVAGTPGTLSFATTTVEGGEQFISSQAILDSILQLGHENGGLNGFLLLFPLDSGARRADRFQTHFVELIVALRDRGYEFVRVDQLLDDHPARRPVEPSLADLKHPEQSPP